MNKDENKTAIETIRGFIYDGEPHDLFADDALKAILELDARLSTLETSAKASEPKECICEIIGTAKGSNSIAGAITGTMTLTNPDCLAHDEKIGCRVGKSFADPKFVESHLHKKIDVSSVINELRSVMDDIHDRMFIKTETKLKLQSVIKILERNSKKEEK